MACCLFAAFLFAQCMAMLRRWGMFWGLIRIPQDEIADTFYTRLAAWLARPSVRRVAAVLLAVELAGVGAWVYVEHGAHLAGIATAIADSAQVQPVEDEICRGGADGEVRGVATVAAPAVANRQLSRL